ncbi:MAG: hypothetical protein QM681_11565 [Novosphingobium sp.]
MSDTLETQLADLLRRLPDWIRRDLSASDPARRERSEEVLHAMLLALIADQSRAGPATSD